MGSGEIIAIIIIAIIIGLAVFYIIKAKKSGRKCIGCPDGHSCPHKKGGGKNTGGGCCCCKESPQEKE